MVNLPFPQLHSLIAGVMTYGVLLFSQGAFHERVPATLEWGLAGFAVSVLTEFAQIGDRFHGHKSKDPYRYAFFTLLQATMLFTLWVVLQYLLHLALPETFPFLSRWTKGLFGLA